ncbi:hypothetical protein CMI47_22150 [Candidatus Pacearchaeota archaeon]|nr:hypothetical protein [Candidatus Pacearchaeota archaeon]|tara:strand:- start:26605 stop:27312 length:708 start_codon:yes stop_codon:yes gene_type:complete
MVKKEVSEREEKIEEKESKKKVSLKKNKELYFIFGVLIGLIVLFLATSAIFNSLNSFEYEGLTFTKEKFGEIPVYHHYYYIQKITGGVVNVVSDEIIKYNLFLRYDPRKNDVPIEGSEIEFGSYEDIIYVSVDGFGLEQCEQSSIAVSSLSSFLTNNLLSVKGATPRQIFAEVNEIPYVTCETHPDNVVIQVQEGDETKVFSDGNCHIIEAANCEVLQAVEKFEVKAVVDAKRRG